MFFERTRRVAAWLVIGAGLGSTAAWGETIDTCGQLTLSTGCVLFQADTGGTFELDTARSFGSGDRVRVVGTRNATCTTSCPAAAGCVTVTSMVACGSEFSACGTLVQDGVCVLFQTDTGGTFVLDRTGNFAAGDRVQISGTVNPNCVTSCAPTNGCIAVATIAACAAQLSSCGLLVQRGACLVFVADHGGTFALETTGGFVAGDRVQVTGNEDPNCTRACGPADGCISGNTIETCGGSFSGCGTLVQGLNCVLFQADSGGQFGLSNRGAFVVGDSVQVTGTLNGQCSTTCATAQTCIAVATIEACPSGFSACGSLFQGATCVLFAADSGSTYVLDTNGGFVVGDRVLVTGTLDRTCISACLATSGCIHGNTITSGTTCPPAPIPVCPTTAAGLVSLSLLGLLRCRRRAPL